MSFSENLKKVRKELKISQHDLAHRLGIAQSTVGMWETSKRTPKLDEIKRLAIALNVTIERLITRPGRKVEIEKSSIYIDGKEVDGLGAVDIQRIIENIQTYQKNLKEQEREQGSSEKDSRGKAKKILIIDDEKDMCELLYTFLVPQNYKVFITFNGQMGLEYYNEIDPDLILLDLALPDIDGREVLKIIRKVSNVPIVVITGNPGDIAGIHLKGLDIEGFISKPFSLEELINTLKQILE